MNLNSAVNHGDNMQMSNNGYFLHFANNYTIKNYRKLLNDAEGAFFGVGSKGIVFDMTLYDTESDWWVTVQLFFEYTIENQVILTKEILPFRPNLYETKNEVQLFWLQIARIIVSLLIIIAEFYLLIKDHINGTLSITVQKVAIFNNVAAIIVIVNQLILIITMK